MIIKFIYQLRVGLSPLWGYKNRHKFLDIPNDLCTDLHPEDRKIQQEFLSEKFFYLVEHLGPPFPPSSPVCEGFINQFHDHGCRPLFQKLSLDIFHFSLNVVNV